MQGGEWVIGRGLLTVFHELIYHTLLLLSQYRTHISVCKEIQGRTFVFCSGNLLYLSKISIFKVQPLFNHFFLRVYFWVQFFEKDRFLLILTLLVRNDYGAFTISRRRTKRDRRQISKQLFCERIGEMSLLIVLDREHNYYYLYVKYRKFNLIKDIFGFKMAHIDATTSAQVQSFLDSHGGVAVVDCHATWCGPCKHIAPFVLKKNQETGIGLIKIDVDQSPELSQAYKIQAMPTFLVLKGKWNNVVETVVGGGQANVNKVYQTAVQNK